MGGLVRRFDEGLSWIDNVNSKFRELPMNSAQSPKRVLAAARVRG